MEQAKASWNDDRLDHLSGQVDRLADRVDSLRDHVDERFDALQRSMIYTLASILAAFGSALLAIQL
jgi:hypothetical protein